MISLAAGFLATFGIGTWVGMQWRPAAPPQDPAIAVPTARDPAAAAVKGGNAPNYRAIVTQFGPAVVGIQDHGSGFIVGSDGIILTSAQVVGDAREVVVTLSDRREFKARVVGSDSVTDVAVLSVGEQSLPTVRFGDSDKLAVGDYVLAIGAPSGFEQMATSGIVSGKGRSVPQDASAAFVQIDVEMDSGASGGPLFDAAGNVIGISSRLRGGARAAQGGSIAIPINLALEVKDQILEHGTAQRTRLGVMLQPLTPPLAEAFKVDASEGVVVSQVVPHSAAARAGVQPGDVIRKLDGQVIRDPGEVGELVGAAVPGHRLAVELVRKGQALELRVELRPPGDRDAEPNERTVLAVRPLTSKERIDSGLTAGIVVERLGEAGESSGLRAGDIIVSIDGREIRSMRQMREVAGRAHEELPVLLARGDSRIFVPIRAQQLRRFFPG
jgi:serine protease Do